jgi:predicted dehydrogenase
MIGIGLIGYGYWGPNLARNFSELPTARLVVCSDLRAERLGLLARKYPEVGRTASADEVIAHPQVDAVTIATPISTHYDLAKKALLAGKHVLIEKPMTMNTAQADELIELAARRRLVLMVDHTFVYTGAVRKIKEIIAQGEVGDIYYFDSVRVNLGLFQHDVNVIWDLAPHDLAIMDFLLDQKPEAVSATGARHIGHQQENIAYITLHFANNMIGHIHVNWLAPVKLRTTLISGTRKMIVYDDMETSEKIKVYDAGVSLRQDAESIYHTLVQYRTGDMYAPKLDQREALSVECEHFIDCIRTGGAPVSDGQAGRRVVAMLEAAQQSLTRRGAWIPLP